MKLIYTPGWIRENIPNEQAYYKWLNSVKDGDLVITQEFIPAKKSCLDLGIECWRFTLGKINKNIIYTNDNYPINRKEGWNCWWGSDKEWGEVFPARLIPNHYRLELTEVGQSVIGHKPVYEPLFLYQTRYVYLVERRRTPVDSYKSKHTVMKAYPRNYYVECDQGWLFNCFAEDKQEIKNEGIKFLYSEYLKD